MIFCSQPGMIEGSLLKLWYEKCYKNERNDEPTILLIDSYSTQKKDNFAKDD